MTEQKQQDQHDSTNPILWKPNVIIIDEFIPSECSMAFWLEKMIGVRILRTNQKDRWKLPENYETIVQGNDVLILGTHSLTNIQLIEKICTTFRVFVYDKDKVHTIKNGITKPRLLLVAVDFLGFSIRNQQSLDTYSEADRLNALCLAFDPDIGQPRELKKDYSIGECVAQYVRSLQFETFDIKLRSAFESQISIIKMVDCGREQLKLIESITDLWASNAVAGSLDGLSVMVVHAHPFITETAQKTLTKYDTIDAVVTFRHEQQTIRFTIIPRDAKKHNVLQIAKKRNGGGSKEYAGFGLDFVSGMLFLSDMVKYKKYEDYAELALAVQM